MKYLVAALLFAWPAGADPAVVEDAFAKDEHGGWTISVTLRHADTGWEDYADAWRVELPDGKVLATRALTHPHVTEQPFTRSQTGIAIPEGVDAVEIRSRTTPDGWSDKSFRLVLP